MSPEQTFGRFVRERRRALDLTQEELSRRVGCAAITVRKIEANDLRPSVQIAERLAMALGIHPDERPAFIRQARAARPGGVRAFTPVELPKAQAHTDLSGQTIRGYTLAELLGTGGTGAVYRAIQPQVERDVAVKIIMAVYADHPDFIRRFEAEAQRVARLEHPHVVPLYDYWREPGVACLIMRLLRGGSLKTWLRHGPLPLSTALRVLEQICPALHVAHRVGIVHGDLKPANVLLDEYGNAYLADFGIVADLRHLTAKAEPGAQVLGTCLDYSPPEQLAALALHPHADIYSLGVMLHEMLTGSLPGADSASPDLAQSHSPTPLPLLAAQPTDLPAAVDAVIRRAVAKDPATRYANVMQLLADLRAGLAGAAPVGQRLSGSAGAHNSSLKLENPYKGLRAFSEADADDFFGREALVQRLLARLSDESDTARFLAIVGPSGSGKSSVVKAGLLPALRRGGLPGSENWFMVDFTPGPHPFKELEAALLRVAVTPPANLAEQLRAEDYGLLNVVQHLLPSTNGRRETSDGLVLVIDQFEENFTLVQEEAERAAFLMSLITAVLEPESPVWVVITLRADFADRPLRYVDFGELMQRCSELVLPLTPDELELAIVGPAQRVGLTIEPSLIAAIVSDVKDQPGALPLLQHALAELFERREDRLLSQTAYLAIGGVRGALGRHAEEAYARLNEAGQAAARQLLLRLVTPAEGAAFTRRRVLRQELQGLAGKDADPRAAGERQPGPALTPNGLPSPMSLALEAFGRSRLLTFDRDPLTWAPTVEVAHEALLDEWPRLRVWLAGAGADLRLQRRLALAAAEWRGAQCDASYLLSGTRLAQLADWAAASAVGLTHAEQAYLEASLHERNRQAAAERQRREQELNTLHQLAEAERARAEHQTHAARQLRRRALYLAGALLLAVGAALAAGLLADRSAALAEQNAASAATAQAASTQAIAEHVTAEANLARAEAQRLAAEANTLLRSNGSSELIALLSVTAMRRQYLPEADAALAGAAALNYPLQLFAGHTQLVSGVALSPDGMRAATGSDDHTARLWHTATGQEIRRLAHPDIVYQVAFSPDGRYLLTNCADTIIRLWDTHTGQLLRTFRPGDFADQPVFSPDGRRVLAASRDGVVQIWDAETGRGMRRVELSLPERSRLFISPDGEQVLSQSLVDNRVRLWRLAETATEAHPLPYFDSLYSVAFSPDAATILTGYAGGDAILWKVASGQQAQVFRGHTLSVTSVAFSPDGEHVLTSSLDKSVRLWDSHTGAELLRLGHPDQVFAAAFSTDGLYVLAGSNEGAVRLWDTQPRPELPTFSGHTAVASALDFSPDGKHLATGGSDGVRLWETDTGQLVEAIPTAGTIGYGLRFSPDGQTLLSGNWAGVATLWDISTGQALRQFALPTVTSGAIYDVAFSPDGQHILGAGAYDSIFPAAQVWATSTGQVTLAAFVPYRMAGAVARIAASPDGRFMLTAHQDGLARLWGAQTGVLEREFAGHTDDVNGAAFSPNGETIATASSDTTARLWDVDSGQEIVRLVGHTASVWSVTFSPDGEYVATASADGTARIWDARRGQELRRLSGHAAGVENVAFTPDGRYLATVSDDGTARLWDVDYRTTVEYLCARLLRDLTDAERAQYGLQNQQQTCP
ncbi:MAG: protein kinase [Anaerolineales bacterium]|nr:protein kinase [Anaerolineales bacterium]